MNKEGVVTYFWELDINVSRDSVVGLANRYWLDDRGVGIPSPGGVKNFHLSMSLRLVLESIQPSIHWIPGAPSAGVKLPGREADHSSSSSAEVKKTWVYTSTHLHAFVAW
jgi:hypothetical protein